MRSTALHAAGLTILLTVVAGCGRAGAVEELPDGTAVLVSGPTGSGSDAAVAGPLSVVDGCLGLGDQVVVFPHGTEVAEGSQPRIVLPGGEVVGLGDEVSGGGGSHAYDELPGPAPRVPESCRGAGEVGVLWQAEAD